ncbi:hypothetical protein D3C72_2081990 [compost metagenome]
MARKSVAPLSSALWRTAFISLVVTMMMGMSRIFGMLRNDWMSMSPSMLGIM